MGREWIKIKEFGQLYIEKVLVTFDVPILFVCVDYEGRKYLCLNVDDENGKYVIAEINNQNLIAMLTNKISMESVFRKSRKNRVIIAEYDSEKEKIITMIENSTHISGELLPKEGAFFEISNSMVLDYIELLRKQLVKVTVEDFSEKKIYKIEQCGYHAYFAFEENHSTNIDRMYLANSKDNCLYEVRSNGKMIA